MNKLDTKYFLKWLSSEIFNDEFNNFYLINHCLLVAFDKTKNAAGMTAFEPRDLNTQFMLRLRKRVEDPAFQDLRFTLYLPLYLKHRVETLFSQDLLQHVTIDYTAYVNVGHVAGKIVIQNRLRVVNIDDSPVLLKLLEHTFAQLGFVELVGQFTNSETAATNILNLKPDLITMDIQMPVKNGVQVVKELLAVEYFPILMISSLQLEEGPLIFDALNAGAFDYLSKPKYDDLEQFKAELAEKILMAVEGKKAQSALQKAPKRHAKQTHTPLQHKFYSNSLWCIGASTGGTQALTQVLTSLPSQIPPTLIVQHIPPVYSKAFADSLNNLCPFTVKEAEHNEKILPNCVYVAPGGWHMGVVLREGQMRIELKDSEPINRFKPSVDYLFKSVAQLGRCHIVAGVMTGMGRDGAVGLLALKKSGAQTFAQDEASSAVYGMPRAAFELGAVDTQVSLLNIAQALLEKSIPPAKVA